MAHERTAYDEKLESILRTAAVIFAEKGYHQASIRDIARATRVSLSGLYYYFKSKEELLFLIQDHAFGTLLWKLERLLEGVEDPHRRLRLLMENHLRFFVSNMAEMKVLSHEAESLTGEYRARVNEKKRRLSSIAMEILAELRPETDLDLRVATFALFGMMNWLYNWYRPGRDVPIERLAEDMSRLFLGGYLQEGGTLPAGARDAVPGERAPSIWRSDAARR
ncbi:MAG: TetR/AcrR family transcriptional regulator [Gemmatimonadota bacterium]|nr:TetR/AcrR family transcriptional regulator [Gemmatimonadota bacterium]